MLIDVRIIYWKIWFYHNAKDEGGWWMEADVGWGIEVIAQVKVDGGISWILFLERRCLLFIWEVEVYVDEMERSMILW